MSRVYSDTVLPEDSGVNQDFTFGTTSDTVQVTSGATLKVNTLKDSGGNTIFTSDGSGNLSSVNSGLVAGGPTLLQTNSFTGASSSSFTSGIGSTYKLYLFSFYGVNPVTDASEFTVNFSSDGGSNYNVTKTTNFYNSYQNEAATDAVLSYFADADIRQSTAYQILGWNVGSGADESIAGQLYLFNPSSTTYVKHFYSTTQEFLSADYAQQQFISGYLNTTSAVDAVDFKMDSGNMDGVIKMYGL